MKKYLLALLLAFVSVPAFALDGTATVGADSQFAERGQLVSDQASAYLNVRFTDLGVEGLFVDTNVRALNLDVNDPQIRLRAGVGYGIGSGNTNASVGVYHVNFKNETFNEVRAQGSLGLGERVSLIGRTAVTLNTSHDAYVAGGLSIDVLPQLNVTALVSGNYYDDGATGRWNNSELTANYKLTENLQVFGTYSKAGDPSVFARTDEDYSVVGVNYTF